MAKPIKVTILGDIKDLVDKLTQGEGGVAGFASKVGNAASDVAKHAAKMGTALVAAGGLGGAIAESLDRGRITAALGAALGATPDEAARYGRAAGQLYAQGYGESFEQVTASVEAVVSTLGKMDGGQLEALAGKASDLASAFKVDVNGAVNSVGILLRTGLAADANAAFDLITRGMQSVPVSVRQELLDASDEYSVFFQGLGFSGDEAFGVLAKAAQGGKIQLDKAGDALKEFRIRSVDMSKKSVEAYQAIGLDAEAMAQRILAGGESAKGAFREILTGVLSIQDPVKRETAAVGLFGTQFEDLGNIDALAALDPMRNALSGVGGAADRLGKSLHDNASANIDAFTRSVSTAFVDVVGGKVIPILGQVVGWLSANLGPALSVVGAILDATVVPALAATARFVADNGTAVAVIAGLITALFVPAMVAAGVTSTISGAQQAAAWVKAQLAASSAALSQVAAGARAVGAWIAQSAAATVNAAKVVGAYALMGVQATVEGAKVAAAWALSSARTLGSLMLASGGFVVQGAVMVASMAGTAASVVAGWVVMGVQSLIRAAEMAAAWVLAMGPVGWIIAAVVGLVALIIANWDAIVGWTKAAWQWAVDAVVGAVNSLLDAVAWLGGLPAKVGGWFGGVYDAAVGKLLELLSWLGGLPGRVVSSIGQTGSLLVSAGGDLLSGLWRGIENAAGWLKDKVLGFFGNLLPSWAKDALGIHSPSRSFADVGRWIPPGIAVGITGNTAPAIAAVGGLAATMASELAGSDLGTPLAFALAAGGAVVAMAGTTGTKDGTNGTDTAPQDGPGPTKRGTTTVNVYATTNADPVRIGNEVAWAVRNTGR
ncbi:phage tail tape measure protein [Actinosynnema sp. NPDC020468]|uniref:phage tail tape measure protein n=1 Tax=Actinosynnema sp. NPDC020468 TaxID=3154488 RepID=UPI0033C6517C